MKRTAVLVAAALLGAPIAARADGAIPPKARALAERGRAFHDAGDYASAIAAFTQAYVIAPSPALLFNLAQAYRLQGNCDDAALMYQRYLDTDPGADGRALAETHLANMQRCLHKIALHIPSDAATATASITVPAPVTASVVVDHAQPTTSHKAQVEKDVGAGLTIGGSVALAAALYYTVQAHNAQNDVSNAETKGGKGNVGAIDQRGQSAASHARILAVGGALGVVGGIVMYVVGKRDEMSPVVVAPVSHGATASMRWTF